MIKAKAIRMRRFQDIFGARRAKDSGSPEESGGFAGGGLGMDRRDVTTARQWGGEQIADFGSRIADWVLIGRHSRTSEERSQDSQKGFEGVSEDEDF
jgi:hypothetical protein